MPPPPSLLVRGRVEGEVGLTLPYIPSTGVPLPRCHVGGEQADVGGRGSGPSIL